VAGSDDLPPATHELLRRTSYNAQTPPPLPSPPSLPAMPGVSPMPGVGPMPPGVGSMPGPMSMPSLQPADAFSAEPLPAGVLAPGVVVDGLPPAAGMTSPNASSPIFAELVQSPSPRHLTGLRGWWFSRNIEAGVGRERLANAP